MLKQFDFDPSHAQKCLNNNKHNQVTTVYYLLHKRYEKQGVLPSHFNITSHRDAPRIKEKEEKPTKATNLSMIE